MLLVAAVWACTLYRAAACLQGRLSMVSCMACGCMAAVARFAPHTATHTQTLYVHIVLRFSSCTHIIHSLACLVDRCMVSSRRVVAFIV